jgi:hypothetical protein
MVKKQILEKRKNMMIRSIYTQLKCKQEIDWTPARITQVVNYHEMNSIETRPKRVSYYLEMKEKEKADRLQAFADKLKEESQ